MKDRAQLSPNQLAKQQQIVDAARHVLATQGLAACTAREIAAAGPLTKSAIHYYFADITVLIDRAMDAHVAALEQSLRAAGPFWDTVDAYLATFREQPHVTRLWFEYWISATRAGRGAVVAAMHDRITAVLEERLTEAGAEDAAGRARSVFVYLLGAVVDGSVRELPASRLRADVAALARLAPVARG